MRQADTNKKKPRTTMESDKMRQTNMNESKHELIDKPVAEFLAGGGKIEQIATSIYNREIEYQQKNKSAFGEAVK